MNSESKIECASITLARGNACKLRDVASYYDKLSDESKAHGFTAAPMHHKEVADFLRMLADHIDVPMSEL